MARLTESKLRRIIRSEVRRAALNEMFGLKSISPQKAVDFWHAATEGGYLSQAGMEAFAFPGAERMCGKVGGSWVTYMTRDMQDNGSWDRFCADHPELCQ